jgi:phosphoribosylformylglycinamidine cyclo-ligase
MTQSQPMTYAGVGVDYNAMDPFKRLAQLSARRTAGTITRFDFWEVEASRGESVYLIETPDCYLAHVEEGLGTKNLVADAMYQLTGKSYYDQIAQDTVAMIVNDMITRGALPLSVEMHLAVGASIWFDDEKRCRDLVEGWTKACLLAGCAWGGGETPTLKGIVVPGTVVLSGSAMGMIKPKHHLITGNIQAGDRIIFLQGSGIHANGLTLAREIAGRLPEGYLAKLPDGRTYGETLLDPTPIYVPVIEECLQGLEIHYAVNITGHGWRKLMRAPEPFVYVIEEHAQPLPIFEFIQQHGPVTDEEAYGNLNMGAGFALYVPSSEVQQVVTRARRHGVQAWIVGHIEKNGEDKRVIIRRARKDDLVFEGKTLAVR